MYRYLSNMKIRTRFVLLIFIAVAGFLITVSVILTEDYKTAKNAANFQELADLAPVTGQLIHELQKERGASALYLGTFALNNSPKELTRQKNTTDSALNKFTAQIARQKNKLYSDNFKNIVTTLMLDLDQLRGWRQDITDRSATAPEMTSYYTETISHLLTIISQMGKFSLSPEITEDFIAFKSFMEAKESLNKGMVFGCSYAWPG